MTTDQTNQFQQPDEQTNLVQQSIWVTLLAILVYIFWRTSRYLNRLLRQPRLVYDLIRSDHTSPDEIKAQALLIATGNIRSGIEKRLLTNGEEKWVLCAGIRNFREPWARDFGFASFGLLNMEETEVVRDCLEVFLIHQQPDGHFPVKVHSTNVIDRYLHSLLGKQQPNFIPIKPKYITAHNTISLDGNGLLVVAALHYIQSTGDRNFLRRYWTHLKRGVTWMENHAALEDGLLLQGPYTDWADSIARSGRIIYTNVIYWKALQQLAEAAQRYGQALDEEIFSEKAKRVAQAINDHFWREDLGYYITSSRFDTMLSSPGNLLAIAWDLTTPAQAHAILDRMAEFNMAEPVPTQVTNHSYPTDYIGIENRLAGIRQYHTHAAWLWIGGWHVVALTKMGRQAEAEEVLQRICRAIVKDGVVHEVYDQNGDYLSTFWYTSEAPLTWSAAMVVHAHHVLTHTGVGVP
jgi:GH15 family glucan-1,4-alpha-glucosidase